jgi:hypothetical protein
MKKRSLFICFLMLALVALRAGAEEANSASANRVGGDYKVAKIKKQQHGFTIQFESTVKTGKYDRLILESAHVHEKIAEGSVLRLSAEVDRKKDDGSFEVSQVLLFFPSAQGKTPIWLISKNRPVQRLNGASKYLEMHAPTSDYLVF